MDFFALHHNVVHGERGLQLATKKLNPAGPIIIVQPRGPPIKTVNLKSDMPLVREALGRLERELGLARQNQTQLLKIIHGYGSTGAWR